MIFRAHIELTMLDASRRDLINSIRRKVELKKVTWADVIRIGLNVLEKDNKKLEEEFLKKELSEQS